MSWQPTAKPFSLLVNAIRDGKTGTLGEYLDAHPEAIRERTAVPADQQIECGLPGSISMLTYAVLSRSQAATATLLAASAPSGWPDAAVARALAERLAASDQRAVRNPASREAALLLRGAPRGLTPREAMMESGSVLAALCAATLREESAAARRVMDMRETDAAPCEAGKGRRPHP